MQEKILNIVSFDNPFPPSYGGIIDVYYKIKALHQIGYKIHLHCFVAEIPETSIELQKIVASVYFYEAQPKWFHLWSSLPISVISRSNPDLVNNLLKNDAPILFESLKTTCLLQDIRLKNRIKLLRYHNIEHLYFKGIANSETSLLKKILFYIEYKRYTKYEGVLERFDAVLTLSNYEHEYVLEKNKNSVYIPVFHGNNEVAELSEFGEYVFYHGDLNTADNRRVASYLIEVFKEIPNLNLIIASGSHQDFINKEAKDQQNVQFVLLENFEHLKELLNKAHICISWSFQKSGTKLKLINALFNSRHSIINENIIDDEAVVSLCSVVQNKETLKEKILFLNQQPYSVFEIGKRKAILENQINDLKNALKIENCLQKL